MISGRTEGNKWLMCYFRMSVGNFLLIREGLELFYMAMDLDAAWSGAVVEERVCESATGALDSYGLFVQGGAVVDAYEVSFTWWMSRWSPLLMKNLDCGDWVVFSFPLKSLIWVGFDPASRVHMRYLLEVFVWISGLVDRFWVPETFGITVENWDCRYVGYSIYRKAEAFLNKLRIYYGYARAEFVAMNSEEEVKKLEEMYPSVFDEGHADEMSFDGLSL